MKKEFKPGDWVLVKTEEYKEYDAIKYFNKKLYVLSTSDGATCPVTKEPGYISGYSLEKDGTNIAEGGIWFSSLKLIEEEPELSFDL